MDRLRTPAVTGRRRNIGGSSEEITTAGTQNPGHANDIVRLGAAASSGSGGRTHRIGWHLGELGPNHRTAWTSTTSSRSTRPRWASARPLLPEIPRRCRLRRSRPPRRRRRPVGICPTPPPKQRPAVSEEADRAESAECTALRNAVDPSWPSIPSPRPATSQPHTVYAWRRLPQRGAAPRPNRTLPSTAIGLQLSGADELAVNRGEWRCAETNIVLGHRNYRSS